VGKWGNHRGSGTSAGKGGGGGGQKQKKSPVGKTDCVRRGEKAEMCPPVEWNMGGGGGVGEPYKVKRKKKGTEKGTVLPVREGYIIESLLH